MTNLKKKLQGTVFSFLFPDEIDSDGSIISINKDVGEEAKTGEGKEKDKGEDEDEDQDEDEVEDDDDDKDMRLRTRMKTKRLELMGKPTAVFVFMYAQM